MNPVKLFISYAHKDEEYKDQLVQHLSGIRRKGWIDDWNDRKIQPGELWDDNIKDALASAEIIVFLVSADFMASDYIYDVEINQALLRSRRGEVIIAPIIIRPCDFSSLNLSEFQALPTGAKAITTWDNMDSAWLDVIEGLKKTIGQLRGTTPEEPETPVAETSSPSSKPLINDFHRFTCDRVKHSEAFRDSYKLTKKEGNKKQFYYIYGNKFQSHTGFFNRIAYEREGRLQDYINTKLERSCRVLKIDDVTFEFSEKLEYYKENILKSLLAGMSIPVNDHEPILEKNLAYLYEKSPSVKGLNSEDYVCIFISISELDWDANITPTACRWLIREFCASPLPEDAPSFIFFFGIKYRERSTRVQDEVEKMVTESEYINALPKLSMVPFRDVAKWFDKYEDAMANSARQWEGLLDQHFGNDPEFYMSDIEDILKKIIDDYNADLR